MSEMAFEALEALPGSVDAIAHADLGELGEAVLGATVPGIEGFSRDCLERYVAASNRVLAAVAARQAAAVAAYALAVVEEEASRERDRLARWEVAAEAAAQTGMPRPHRPRPLGCSSVQMAAASLAPLLHVAPRTMAARIGSALLLGELPRTLASALDGRLEPHRWIHVTRALSHVGIERGQELEARLHDRDIAELSGSQVKARCQRIEAAFTALDASVERAAKARRMVTIDPADEPGLTAWSALLPSEDSTRMWSAVEELAREYRVARAELTVGQSRADALTDLVLAQARVSSEVVLVVAADRTDDTDDADCTDRTDDTDRTDYADRTDRTDHADDAWPVATGAVDVDTELPATILDHPRQPAAAPAHRPGLAWVPESAAGPAAESALEWRWLLAACDSEAADANPRLRRDRGGSVWFVPAAVTVPRVGTILPEHVAALLADPDTLVRLGTRDPRTGVVLAVGAGYRPGANLARAVRLRDGTCRFPGCATPAERCDLDHVVPWPCGRTEAGNLVALCRTHHGFKHHAGWTLELAGDGECTWTAPTGRSHRTRPPDLGDRAA